MSIDQGERTMLRDWNDIQESIMTCVTERCACEITMTREAGGGVVVLPVISLRGDGKVSGVDASGNQHEILFDDIQSARVQLG